MLDAVAQHVEGVSVNDVSYTLDDAEALRLKEIVLNDAIDRAKDNAARRADRLGVRLGAMVGYKSSLDGLTSMEDFGLSLGAASMSARSAPTLPAGESQIHVRVLLTYEIAK